MIVHKGETVFRQGDNGPLFRLKSGLLKIVRVHEDGHMIVVNLIVAGEVIPHHSLVSEQPYHGTAIALMTSELETIPSREWYDDLAAHPEKALEIALLLQSRLRLMQQRIDQLTRTSPAEKLSKLQEWLASFAGPIPISELLTQDEIGQFIGLRRETVNRLLRSGGSK
ncbi:Crp/Fnr family transcriptional regulator [Paenibacillus agaridevorans]|uniref:Crp/Fnr family transcriptional regulator n=1 Tax=Paenibacillus agaridevorans TaxID=171404 RepID=UPI001BE435AD|nr:Crp/Fnr family transcriptional regulator [Paenibacillus agaridevorans]